MDVNNRQIRVSKETWQALNRLKEDNCDTFDDVIVRLINFLLDEQEKSGE